jgi:hypothetical protein
MPANARGQLTGRHDAGAPLRPGTHAVSAHDVEVARLEAMAEAGLPFAAPV